ncbi:MAG TPA: ASCH domain-containing protein [Acidimicrobiales bacterium]|jgi:hypothetical protein|nr:ASCH domain-containing protein [Acidimicrobiales bacterium]
MKDSGRAGMLSHLTRSAGEVGWDNLLDPFCKAGPPEISLHLAVLIEPYLSFILDGQKTVESRFSIRAMPPYRRVERGDIVLLKESGGPIVGAFTAAAVWFYELDADSWSDLRREFAEALCAQAGFWEARETAAFATLIRISEARKVPPMRVPKRDRRAWVVLADRAREGRLL